MIYSVALASSDGVNIDSHFGAAKRFYIAQIDTQKVDYEITGYVDVTPSCSGGSHETAAFASVLETLGDVAAIVAQRIGPGAQKYIKEQGIAAYQIPLEAEQALCLLLEEKEWEAGKWQYHMRN